MPAPATDKAAVPSTERHFLLACSCFQAPISPDGVCLSPGIQHCLERGCGVRHSRGPRTLPTLSPPVFLTHGVCKDRTEHTRTAQSVQQAPASQSWRKKQNNLGCQSPALGVEQPFPQFSFQVHHGCASLIIAQLFPFLCLLYIDPRFCGFFLFLF